MEGGEKKKRSLFLCVEEPLKLMVLGYLDGSDGLGPLELWIQPTLKKVLKLPL